MKTKTLASRVCTECKEEKPLTEFYKNSVYVDGHNARCKECVKKYAKGYSRKPHPNWITVNCSWCSRPIQKNPFFLKRNKLHFCNIKCQKKYEASKIVRCKIFCLNCGKNLFPTWVQFRNRKSKKFFCRNSRCKEEWRKKQIFPFGCLGCGKTIYKTLNILDLTGQQFFFCSLDCKNTWAVGENSWAWYGGTSFEPYGLEFNERLREKIRLRDGYCCQICELPEMFDITSLSIHHINYDKRNNNPTNLISLCAGCHQKTNNNRSHWTKLLKRKQQRRFRQVKKQQLHFRWDGNGSQKPKCRYIPIQGQLGPLPYGYTNEKGRAVPDPTKQEIIRAMVILRKRGYFYSQIASKFNTVSLQNFLPKKGKWHGSGVERILKRWDKNSQFQGEGILDTPFQLVTFPSGFFSETPLASKMSRLGGDNYQEIFRAIKILREYDFFCYEIAERLNGWSKYFLSNNPAKTVDWTKEYVGCVLARTNRRSNGLRVPFHSLKNPDILSDLIHKSYESAYTKDRRCRIANLSCSKKLKKYFF